MNIMDIMYDIMNIVDTKLDCSFESNNYSLKHYIIYNNLKK